jgi:dTDP-4-amino-4,6-dideoxygalactose transaminase
MTDLQAALGLSQLTRLDTFVSQRHTIARCYDEALNDLPVETPGRHPDSYSALHLYVVRFKLDEIRQTQREVFDHLRAAGIGVNLHYIPVYLQPYYERLGFMPGYCPNAERFYREACSLPIFPGLTDEAQKYIVDVLKTALHSGASVPGGAPRV